MSKTYKTIKKSDLSSLEGKTATIVGVSDNSGYEPTWISFDIDGLRYVAEVGSVNYDQYSSSPCLTFKVEEKPKPPRQVAVTERCGGTGAYARDLAGNPSGQCIVCGHFGRLTKRGTIRY